MQYQYTLESQAPIKVDIAYRDLTLIRKLLKEKADSEWRAKELLAEVEAVMREAANALASHYDYETRVQLREADA
jgi:hypothetical protein